MRRLVLLALAFSVLISCSKKESTLSSELIYKDESQPIEKRIEDLLARMTLDDKIGQMTQMCQSTITLDGTKALNLKAESLRPLIVDKKIGSILSGSGNAEDWVTFITEMQKMAIEETELGIPIIYGMDHVHGADYVDEATIFPHNLLVSCSFNPELMKTAGKITANESASLGHVWNFAPVLDVGKNPSWPRFYETFGEDPLICGSMGTAFIKGYQECEEIAPYKVAACAKHFIGYSDPKSGWDRTASEIPMQRLYEDFMPSFRMAFDAGVKTLMVNSGELNGEPVHSSKFILTDLLRDYMKFDGVVLTDIKDIMKIVEMHGGAVNEKEATLMSIQAGIDMYMACNETDFIDYMNEWVAEGKITEERIDESVRRLLKLKFELGLFENPYPTKDLISKIGSVENKKEAAKAAEESIVLMKNKNSILPLQSPSKIIISGPASNSKFWLDGPWTFEWMGAEEEERHPEEMKTIYEAVKAEFPSAIVEYIPSEGINLNSFMEKSKSADVIVLAIGEKPYSEFKGDIMDMNLDLDQQNLIHAAKISGKPVIATLIEGRPRVLTQVDDQLDAILFACYPGFGGADAIAGIISGRINPSGKLSFTYPNAASHFSPYYHKVSEYHHKENRPQLAHFFPTYTFGHGLSYSTFEYSDISISADSITSTDSIDITFSIKNTSDKDGMETALLYIRDEYGKITRPVKQLKRFEKRLIKAGKKTDFKFTISAEKDLWYPNKEGEKIIEDGFFQVIVGDTNKRFYLKNKIDE